MIDDKLGMSICLHLVSGRNKEKTIKHKKVIWYVQIFHRLKQFIF